MRFRYRFVPFGTSFVATEGVRASTNRGKDDVNCLHDNELAVDVGGTCWNDSGESRWVLDHHFRRKDNAVQFPSASAAVVALADDLREHCRPFAASPEGLWLVTHWQPDFDAFCAAYLARRLTEGVEFASPPSNWFDPAVDTIPTAERWPLLLAALASRVDQNIRLACPANRAAHAVLYAALQRNRPYLTETDGAREFFDLLVAGIADGLNPLYDDLFARSPTFAPELGFLDLDAERYRRDLRRARRSIVSVPAYAGTFDQFFEQRSGEPLLHAAGTVAVNALPSASLVQFEAVWIRDPESLLFKEWARHDPDAASGAGYTFTAVAYPHGRSGLNDTDYFFALDPERAGAAHLYGVWAALQKAEVEVLRSHKHGAGSEAPVAVARSGYERRAGSVPQFFDDPWFDGSNYACTIVATPNRGTAIAPAGIRSDLTDDPVAKIVQRQLEWHWLQWPAHGRDEAARGAHATRSPDLSITSETVESDKVPRPSADVYRWIRLPLIPGAAIGNAQLTAQLGRLLWELLQPDTESTVPSDFESRHLLADSEMIVVWSRQGVAIAHEAAAETRARGLVGQFTEITSLGREVANQIARDKHGFDPSHSEELLTRAARVRHDLAGPEGRFLRRFFDARGFDRSLTTLADRQNTASTIELARSSNELSRRTSENLDVVAEVQKKVEFIEVFIVGFYAAELTHILLEDVHEGLYDNVTRVAGVSLVIGLIGAICLVLPPGAQDRSMGDYLKSVRVKIREQRASVVLLSILFAYLMAWIAFGVVQARREHSGAAVAHDAEPLTPQSTPPR